MRLFVTNDDGIESEGIHVLARVLHDAGHDVLVAAPDRDWSGAGAALGHLSPEESIDVREVELPDCDGVPAWSVTGPPALTVLAARLGAFGESPDVVVSGINAGLNTGRSILHSGTVGAALTAQNFGLSGLAVSVAWGKTWQWDTAAACALDVLDRVIDAPPRSVLNLNVPSVPYDGLRGMRWARLAPFGAVRAAMAGAAEGRIQMELTSSGEKPPSDTDQGTVDEGYASLTTLVGVAEAWPDDEHLGPTTDDLSERIVPGAPFEAVHRVPDASVSRVLHQPQSSGTLP